MALPRLIVPYASQPLSRNYICRGDAETQRKTKIRPADSRYYKVEFFVKAVCQTARNLFSARCTWTYKCRGRMDAQERPSASLRQMFYFPAIVGLSEVKPNSLPDTRLPSGVCDDAVFCDWFASWCVRARPWPAISSSPRPPYLPNAPARDRAANPPARNEHVSND